MARIIWSPEASRRLIEIAAYMLLVAPEKADSLLDRLVSAAERLGDFPRMGRVVPGFDEYGAREIIVDRFHIVYATDGQTVEISTILHSAMDIPTRLREVLGDP